MGDFCYVCDGTGERDPLSCWPCDECNGTGWREEKDWTDEDTALWEDFHDEFYRREEESSTPATDAAESANE